MKNLILIILILVNSIRSVAQDNSTEFSNLKATNSPAFNMLGIANSDIEHPTELSDFALNIKTATNSFTAIPNNYAFEIAPFLLLRKQLNYTNTTVGRFNNGKFKDVFKQTFLVSFGMNQYFSDKTNTDSTSKMGLGIKFSIIRPKWNNATNNKFQASMESMKAKLNDFADQFRSLQATDTLLIRLKKEGDTEKIQKRMIELKTEINLMELVAEKFVMERKGWFLDFTSGVAFYYPNNNIDNGYLNKGGAWLTGGYENVGDKNFSALGIARYLINTSGNQNLSKAIHTVDVGARLLANDGKNDKYLISGEALWRYHPQDSKSSNWRLVANFEYAIANNQRLTFSFGRSYDGVVTNGGNLIAALNFIRGFGNKKYTNRNELN